MPQLSSGRHVGIDPSRLFGLIRDSAKGLRVAQLMEITAREHLLHYLDIIELLPDEQAGPVVFNPRSAARPAPLVPGEFRIAMSELTRQTTQPLASCWSAEEIEEIMCFIVSDRAIEQREQLVKAVKHQQQNLLAHGEPLPRMLAWWWQAGCHPEQESDPDDLV